MTSCRVLPMTREARNLWHGTPPAFDTLGLQGDPAFTAAGSSPPNPPDSYGDFSLRATSPALHSGTDACALAPTDYFGVARIPGAFDIGAE